MSASGGQDSQDFDQVRPSAARVYDFGLGGGHNFAVDRELGRRALAINPYLPAVAQSNRAFLRRAVLFMAEQGIRQFLDLGSGIPTVGSVHQVAQRADPGCRVLYVDYDDVAVAHTVLALANNELATAVKADVSLPDDVLAAEETMRLLDFDQPIGLLALTVFHYIAPDRDPLGVLARYRDAVAPGSFLAISHFTDDVMGEEARQLVDLMSSTKDKIYPRSRAEIGELFTGFELVEPGLVVTSRWRPDGPDGAEPPPERNAVYAGVGRKRD